MRGRNKLVPRLLGITRESIMRVDENTKEVLKTWPLTTVRRWAASPNSFTLVSGVEWLLVVSVGLCQVVSLYSCPPGLWRLFGVILLRPDNRGGDHLPADSRLH